MWIRPHACSAKAESFLSQVDFSLVWKWVAVVCEKKLWEIIVFSFSNDCLKNWLT